jgi:hypothetical protein
LENRRQIPVGKKVMVAAAAAVAAVVEDHSRIIHKNQSQDLNRKKIQIFKGIMLEYYICSCDRTNSRLTSNEEQMFEFKPLYKIHTYLSLR